MREPSLEFLKTLVNTPSPGGHETRGGIASAPVSRPNHYMHSPVGVVSLKDLEAIPQLLAGLAASLKLNQQFKVKI